MVEEKVSFAIQNLRDGGRIYLVIVTPEPLAPMLPDVGGVVAGLDVADVVDHREEGVLVFSHG